MVTFKVMLVDAEVGTECGRVQMGGKALFELKGKRLVVRILIV